MNDMTVGVGFLITVVLFVVSMINFFTARKNTTSKEVENNVKVNLKLDEICRTTNETRADIKGMQNDIREVQEEQLKQKMRIDALEKNIGVLMEKK